MNFDPVFRNPIQFCDFLRMRKRRGKDTTIHVKGAERSGKSSFAVHLQSTLKPEWMPEQSLFYDWTDLGPLIKQAFTDFQHKEELPEDWWPFFHGDEATNILDALDWNKVENKATKKLFRQWGILGALVILIDPDGRLDPYIMKHRAKVQVVMKEWVKPEDCPQGLRPDQCLSGLVRLQYRDPKMEQPPTYEDQFEWTFPKPYLRWPKQWNAYEGPKLDSVGLRLEGTTQVFEDAAAMRIRNRLKVHSDIKRFQKEIEGE